MPGVEIIIGPMYSGKSTELLRRLNILAEMNLKVLYVNSTVDTRSKTPFSTHNPTLASVGKITAMKISKLEDLTDLSWDVIGIDEAQFFSGLVGSVHNFVEMHDIHVIVSGLNGDSNRAKFGEIIDLIPFCDKIDKLASFCKPCWDRYRRHTDALFSKKIAMAQSDKVVDIGSQDKYIPVCRDCYFN